MIAANEVNTRTLKLMVKDSSRFISLSDPVIGQVGIIEGKTSQLALSSNMCLSLKHFGFIEILYSVTRLGMFYFYLV